MSLLPVPLVANSFDELMPILRARGFWTGLVALALVLGVAGPYGTAETVPLALRMAYWLVIVLATGTFGFVLGFIGCDMLHALGLPKLLAGPLAGAITGLPVSGIVLSINALFLQSGDLALTGGPLILSIIAVSSIISLATTVTFFLAPPEAPPARVAHPTHPRLLDRLPPDLRAPLVALSATDHYTEVTTTLGTSRLLLRLSDAIAEAAPTPGLRIHRSHWVALSEITAARRDGPRGMVTLSDGRERPVSRRSLPLLQEAGFLPPR